LVASKIAFPMAAGVTVIAVSPAPVAQAFQGRDLRLPNRAHRHYAGPHGLAFQHNGAGSALRHAATKPWSTQSQLVI
jgi:hypothetical protein